MRRPLAGFVLLAAGLLFVGASAVLRAEPAVLEVENESPLVTFRILFHTGAASDPAGKQGLSALTAAMLSKGGSREMSYDEIVEAFFPMASSVSAQVDKEMTVFEGTTHVENLDRYYGIVRGMLLDPGWREDDFTRLKDEAVNFLRIGLRGNNEEELGKEFLYTRIYQDHPYGWHNSGTVASLERLTIDDLKAFYQERYTAGNVVVGLAGGYPEGFAKQVAADFSKLPKGESGAQPEAVALPTPRAPGKLNIKIIEKDTRGTHIALGFAIHVNRSSPDWPALKLAQSYLGQHRSSKGRLFQRIREVRGMNYGDYAYIEYFPRGMFQFQPDPNLGRRQQIFHMWIRPVEPRNGVFALRIALYELDKLVREGMPEEAFESTRLFLSKYVNLVTQTQSEQLGYALDSDYYGISDFNGFLKDALAKLTVEQVNQAIRKHLRSSDLDIVVITKDAEGFKKGLSSRRPSKIEYVSPKSKDILDEDKLIGKYKLDVGSVEIIPAGTIFE
jgi:zinc protease